MAEISYPADDYNLGEVTEDEYEELVSFVEASGIVGEVAQNPVVYGDGTGRQIKLRSFRSAKVRGFRWSSGATETIFAIAANAGAVRYDLVVLRLDRATWHVRLAIVQGTSGNPVPTVTQDTGSTGVYEIAVAVVTVGTGVATILAGDVQVVQSHVGYPAMAATNATTLTSVVHKRGQRVYQNDIKTWWTSNGVATWSADSPYVCTNITRPAHQAGLRIWETNTSRSYISNGATWLALSTHVCVSSARPSHQAGLIIWETDTSKAYISTGVAWRLISDDGGTVALTASPNWDIMTSSTERLNGQVTLRVKAKRTGAGTASGTQIGAVAAGFRPTAATDLDATVHGTPGVRDMVLNLATDGKLLATIHDPIVTGDIVYGTFGYRAA